MSSLFHLAQASAVKLRTPILEPAAKAILAEFGRVNADSERASGFVWRFRRDPIYESEWVMLDDRTVLANLSVWENISVLQYFVYYGPHAAMLRQRREWLTKFDSLTVALWWIAAGDTPSVDDARSRLGVLARRGPNADVFTFGRIFPAPA